MGEQFMKTTFARNKFLVFSAVTIAFAFAAVLSLGHIVKAETASLKLFDGHLHAIADDTQKYPRVSTGGPTNTGAPGGSAKAGGVATSGGGLPPGVGGQPGSAGTPIIEKPDIDKRVLKWMDEEGVEAAAAIQKRGAYGTDNSYIIDVSDSHKDSILGVVILDAQDAKTPDQLRDMIKNHNVVGIRLTGGPAEDGTFPWLSSPQALKTWSVANDTGIVVDVMINTQDNTILGVPEILKLAKAYPNVKLVLNHALYPKTEGGPYYGINSVYATMAQQKNIYIKFTCINLDFLRESKLSAPDFVRRLVDVYGADHVLWGSDVGNSGGTYKEIVGRILTSTAKLSDIEKRKVLHDTGKSVYVSSGMVNKTIK
jgi:L-fuconolactonase